MVEPGKLQRNPADALSAALGGSRGSPLRKGSYDAISTLVVIWCDSRIGSFGRKRGMDVRRSDSALNFAPNARVAAHGRAEEPPNLRWLTFEYMDQEMGEDDEVPLHIAASANITRHVDEMTGYGWWAHDFDAPEGGWKPSYLNAMGMPAENYFMRIYSGTEVTAWLQHLSVN